MYNDKIRNTAINDLKSKVIDMANISIALTSQGYFVNKSKYIKLDWSSVLIHAFENIDILNKEQQHNVELLYNKLSTI